jgi:hypothetical protein
LSKNLTTYPGDNLDEDLAHARLQMPGPPFREVLRWIHEDVQPQTYVEIGVHAGESLRAALPGTICIGIDPEPVLEESLNPETRIYAITSDEFFAKHDLSNMLGVPEVALSFIDGLHLAEQTIQDFANLERYTGPQSLILIHDCLPLDARTSTRVRNTSFYSGDAWKILVFLKHYRPHLRVGVIPTMPTGLAVVSGFDRAAVNNSHSPSAISEITQLAWEYFEENSSTLFDRIPNERNSVRRYLLGRSSVR